MIFELVGGRDLLQQVVKQVAVYEAARTLFPCRQNVLGLAGVVLPRAVILLLGCGVSAQHAPPNVLGDTARSCRERFPRANRALVVALAQLSLGHARDQRLYLVLPEGAVEVLQRGVGQRKLVEHVLQQRTRRLHAVCLAEGVSIVVDSRWVFERLDLSVYLVVDQDIEQSVRLGGRERGDGGRHVGYRGYLEEIAGDMAGACSSVVTAI